MYYNNYYSMGNRNSFIPERAIAQMRGGPLAPDLRGIVIFTDVPRGTILSVEVTGLPPYSPAVGNNSPIGPFGFHIHEIGNCAVGNPSDPFPEVGNHWNPTDQPHGNHAGDFPVLFTNNGYARMTFFTNKFEVPQIIGKSIVIHENPDDYRSQPSGNSGRKLACGVIELWNY